jgi:hypothetical protein
MNERIKELAEQAGEYVNEVYTPPVRSKTPGKIWEGEHVDWHTQFNQKFAELIVLRCCEISDEAERADVPVFASKFIKAHFGVER